MSKHASDIDKAAFLVHLQYVHQAEAARRAGLPKQTATDLKNHSAALQIEHAEQEGIPLLEHIGNSSDMNAIEGAWMPMRIAITKDWRAPHTLEWTD